VGDWIGHLTGQKPGSATGMRALLRARDNEPMLWNSTQHDIHPQPGRTTSCGKDARLRRASLADLTAKTLPPDWCAYFYSAADGCSPGADQAAHGGMPLLEWYLAQVHAHELATGTRLVDYLDVHDYPQAGTALNDDESATIAARRLRTVKSLYDPAYVDESWISTPVRLIPRLRAMIDARAPGLGLAITEYNFGGDTGIRARLAQGEVLAVFAREGVTSRRWVAPQGGTRRQDASHVSGL
jgi:hypothetical protein